MISRMPKPGGSTLVQQSSSAHDLPVPGKRTLTEQVAPVAPVQRSPAQQTHGSKAAASGEHTPKIAQPEPGIDQTGFIDNSKGAPIYNRPPEAGGDLVRDAPLPPASRVFASGTYPKLKDWWYVTAFVEGTMLRGYVEAHRINAQLPEPFAELRQLVGRETPEGLAKEKYGKEVRDGHDLRYYENVLLYVNRGRDGISGTYQDPNLLGGGANNIKLYAGHRIWLVSPDYAKALEGVVPSGSLTGGAVAKAKRFGAHLQDILQSVTESRNHFGEVAGEFAQAIRDHLPAIIGITAGFLTLEAGSMFLAATPTGVGQAAAAVIQLALSAFGAAGMIEAGVEALKHGSAWLTTAWTAHGKPELIAEASKAFLRMLVAIAVAALSYLGAKGNYKNALKIANNMPTGSLPAFATVGHAPSGGAGAGAGAGVAIGPSAGGPAVVGAAAVGLHDKEKPALGERPEVDGRGERDVGEARSREGRERRAVEGRDRPTAKEGEGAEADLAPPGLDEAQIEHVRRQLGDSLSRKMATGPDALTGPELVEVADLVSRLRRARNVHGVDDWVAFEESQNARHMRDAIGELRSVERRAAENTGRIYEIGQDAHAPVRDGTINARNPKGDPMKSFDIAERDGNEVVRSIEVTSASTPVKGAPDLTEGVRHATDKVVGRIKEKAPIPGKELEVEIRIELFKGEAGAGKGTVTYDGAGNYTYKVNNGTITPSKFGLHKNPGNIFTDFSKELPKIGGSNTLSVVTLVDESGNVIATFRREGSIWKWLQESKP